MFLEHLNKINPVIYLGLYSKKLPKDILAHHGILGQKWGKRNGPPYPLKASDHSASERKAGWQKSLDKSSGNSHDNNVSKVGGSAAAFIREYGTMPVPLMIAKLAKNRQAVSDAKKLVEKLAVENAANNTAPKGITSKDVNPMNGRLNCGACCMTEELRLRGQAVAAKETVNGMTSIGIMDFFERVPKGNSTNLSTDNIVSGNGQKTRANIAAELAKTYPEGSRGCIYLPMWYGNHYITWENKNGKVEFRDPQNNTNDLTTNCFAQMVTKGTAGSEAVGLWSMRWDNLTFKNDMIGTICYSDQASLSKTYYDKYESMDNQQYKELQDKRMKGG